MKPSFTVTCWLVLLVGQNKYPGSKALDDLTTSINSMLQTREQPFPPINLEELK